jgi:hypothetical protein
MLSTRKSQEIVERFSESLLTRQALNGKEMYFLIFEEGYIFFPEGALRLVTAIREHYKAHDNGKKLFGQVPLRDTVREPNRQASHAVHDTEVFRSNKRTERRGVHIENNREKRGGKIENSQFWRIRLFQQGHRFKRQNQAISMHDIKEGNPNNGDRNSYAYSTSTARQSRENR